MPTTAVLHLTRDLPPGAQGGVSIAALALRQALAETGARQAVLSFDGWRPLRAREAAAVAAVRPTPDAIGPIWRLDAPGSLDRAEAVALDWLAEARAAGCAVRVLLHADLLADFGVRLARAAGAVFTVYAHVLQAEQRQLHGLAEATASERAQAVAFAAAATVFAPSEWAATRLRPRTSGTVVVWPPPASAAQASSPSDGSPSDGPRPAPTLLYLGRFDATKGFDILLVALPEVLRAIPTLRLQLAGGLPHSPKGERRWRRKIADALGADRAELPGFLPHREALLALAAADVVVVPSRLETFGLVAEEAMLAGRCVVAADGGALGERLRDGVDALVVPAGDATALAAALIRALEDPALRETLGIAAHAAASERLRRARVPAA